MVETSEAISIRSNSLAFLTVIVLHVYIASTRHVTSSINRSLTALKKRKNLYPRIESARVIAYVIEAARSQPSVRFSLLLNNTLVFPFIRLRGVAYASLRTRRHDRNDIRERDVDVKTCSPIHRPIDTFWPANERIILEEITFSCSVKNDFFFFFLTHIGSPGGHSSHLGLVRISTVQL